MTKKAGGKNTGVIALIAVFAIVIIALLSVVIFLLSGKEEKKEGKRSVVVTQDNAEAVVEEAVKKAAEYVEPGYYTVSMETAWHFTSSDVASDNARVNNKAENTHDVYFDVFLEADESEPIYESPVIPRGEYLDGIVLDTPLEAGTYPCVMVYHLVDEEQETVSTLRVGFTITVDA